MTTQQPEPGQGPQARPAEVTGHRPAGQPAPPQEGPGGDRAEVHWRSVHKVTPVINAWKALAVFLAFLAWQFGQSAFEIGGEAGRYAPIILLAVLGGLIVFVAIALAYSYFAWRRMKFAVTAESVDLHQGILQRQQRHARLIRVQAVDIVQPLLGRIFGLAQVKVETAGGDDSNVTIGFLKESEAQELRNEILARAAGVKVPDRPDPGSPEAGGPEGASAGTAQRPPVVEAAPEREMLHVPPGRLVGSLVLSPSLLVLILLVAGLTIAAVTTRNPAIFFGSLPGLLGWVVYLWGRFAGEFNFRAAISPDGIRLRRGLLEVRSQTIPPRRVQAIELVQGPLWRFTGWWRVKVNVAGYGLGQQSQQDAGNETVLLSVGPRGDALTALWLALPDLGADSPEEAQAVIDAALEGMGEDAGFWISPRRARWLDPLTWRRNGLRITGTALLMRTGRFVRSLAVVPHGRTQSLAIQQGPLERRFQLANLHAHSVAGPVTPVARHLDEGLAREVLFEQAERARTARAAEGPEEWMRRVGVPGAEERPPAGTVAADAPGQAPGPVPGAGTSQIPPSDPGRSGPPA